MSHSQTVCSQDPLTHFKMPENSRELLLRHRLNDHVYHNRNGNRNILIINFSDIMTEPIILSQITFLWKVNYIFQNKKKWKEGHCFMFFQISLIEYRQILTLFCIQSFIICCFDWIIWAKSSFRQIWSWKRKCIFMILFRWLWTFFLATKPKFNNSCFQLICAVVARLVHYRNC